MGTGESRSQKGEGSTEMLTPGLNLVLISLLSVYSGDSGLQRGRRSYSSCTRRAAYAHNRLNSPHPTSYPPRTAWVPIGFLGHSRLQNQARLSPSCFHSSPFLPSQILLPGSDC